MTKLYETHPPLQYGGEHKPKPTAALVKATEVMIERL